MMWRSLSTFTTYKIPSCKLAHRDLEIAGIQTWYKTAEMVIQVSTHTPSAPMLTHSINNQTFQLLSRIAITRQPSISHPFLSLCPILVKDLTRDPPFQTIQRLVKDLARTDMH